MKVDTLGNYCVGDGVSRTFESSWEMFERIILLTKLKFPRIKISSFLWFLFGLGTQIHYNLISMQPQRTSLGVKICRYEFIKETLNWVSSTSQYVVIRQITVSWLFSHSPTSDQRRLIRIDDHVHCAFFLEPTKRQRFTGNFYANKVLRKWPLAEQGEYFLILIRRRNRMRFT